MAVLKVILLAESSAAESGKVKAGSKAEYLVAKKDNSSVELTDLLLGSPLEQMMVERTGMQ